MARATFPRDQDLQVLTETLQLSQEALSFDSKELAGQLLGRIHGTGSSGLLGQAQEALNAGTLSEEAIPLLSLLEAYEDQASQKNKVNFLNIHIRQQLKDVFTDCSSLCVKRMH